MTEYRIKAVFFALDDVLISGDINTEIMKQQTIDILNHLQALQEKKEIQYGTILTSSPEKCLCRLEESELMPYFKRGMILKIDQAYLDSKAEPDRERYDENLKKDDCFKDEYFKQYALQKFMAEKKLAPDQVLLIAHDYLFDVFYTQRFSKAQIALIKESVSIHNTPVDKLVEGLCYINHDWNELEGVLRDGPRNDFAAFDKYIFDYLKAQLLGNRANALIKQAAVKKQPGEGVNVIKLGDVKPDEIAGGFDLSNQDYTEKLK